MIVTLEELLQHASQHGRGNATMVLLDLDDFHARVLGPGDSDAEESLLQRIFEWVREHMPGAPELYRHGRDALLAVYWGQSVNTILADLYAWRELFRSTSFAIDELRPVTFTFTAAVVEVEVESSRTIQDALRSLEDALFEAKHQGKNRIVLATHDRMMLKTSYYSPLQLRRLASLAQGLGVTESQLLRQALDDFLRKHEV